MTDLTLPSLIQREGRRLLLVATLSAGLATAIGLVLPRQWESSALVLPKSNRGASALLGASALASLLGTSPSGSASPAFLAELATSRDVLMAVLTSSFVLPSDARPEPLVDRLVPSGSSLAIREDKARRKLEKAVRTNVSLKSGMLRVSIRAKHPELARQINARLLAVLDSVNRHRLQQDARAEREFAEARVAEASLALATAERNLQRFEEGNRGWRQSPSTAIEYGRLQRELSLRQGAYAGLVQAAEQARMEELHSASVMSIVEVPSLPSRPVSRYFAVLVPVAALTGMLLVLLLDHVRAAWSRSLAADRAAGEFLSATPPDPVRA